jgi:hypothetical protein
VVIARSAGVGDPSYNLITNHLSLEAASDTNAYSRAAYLATPTASAEDAGWGEALAMA